VKLRLGPARAIAEGAGRGWTIDPEGPARRAFFVVRYRGRLHAYLNSCPHAGVPLDWVPDRFFERAGRYLLCGTHGARFRPEDGVCIAGPCAGRALQPLLLAVDNGEIVIELNPE
jgi:nitrite reductase/ring-hydroxylating ferredoxin subunit